MSRRFMVGILLVVLGLVAGVYFALSRRAVAPAPSSPEVIAPDDSATAEAFEPAVPAEVDTTAWE